MPHVSDLLAHNPFWLAPMAGVNDAAFRELCKEQGAGITFSEMISAKGLHYDAKNNNARMLLRASPREVPIAVQLFGADPDILAEQAAQIAKEFGDNLAFVDINMGCPVPKVVNKGEGSALMKNPALASEIVRSVAEALAPYNKEVTVKFRRGFDASSDNAVEFAVALAESGAAALTVHGRYRSQYYKGTSDSSLVYAIKDQVNVPVLGSGDIFTPQDAVEMLLEQSADGVMIARGAQGNPWIFAQAHVLYDICLKAMEQGIFTSVAEIAATLHLASPEPHEKFDMMRKHAEQLVEYFGRKSLVRMRKHAIWYCAGMPGASYFRGQIQSIATMEDLEQLIDAYEDYLQHR